MRAAKSNHRSLNSDAVPVRTLLVLMGLACLLLVAGKAGANGPAMPPSVISDGGLFFPSDEEGLVEPAPMVATEIEVDVNGLVARYVMRHRFTNPSQIWTDAIYAYPLPEDAAVDRLVIRVGGRVIEGEIQEKQKARETFEEAKQEGRKASLVEQHRPNMFTTEVANIAPLETIEVEIGFQERLTFRDGLVDLALPLVIGPRYLPDAPMVHLTDGGWAQPVAASKDDLPSMEEEVYTGAHNPVDLTVRLKPGFALADLDSPSHPIVKMVMEDGFVVRLDGTQGRPLADRDFTLSWAAEPQAAPQAGLFTERLGENLYGFLMLTPPAMVVEDASDEPRDVVFILDISGSMEGQSIVQAKAALAQAVDRLDDQDRFDLVIFNDESHAMFGHMVLAEAGTRAAVISAIDSLSANGGTEIGGALEKAFGSLTSIEGEERLAQVVLITDGAVYNEADLFRIIDRRIGRASLFTVGIGSAPNRYFMTRAAEMGRGSAIHIETLGQVENRMAELFQRLENPALTALEVQWPEGVVADTAPDPLPDLYAGDPVMLAFQLKGADETGEVVVRGRTRGRHWAQPITFSEQVLKGTAGPGSGLSALWARAEIRDLMAMIARADNADELEAQATRLALEHGLLSAYTSLVAVERDAPAEHLRPEEAARREAEVPRHLPHGWDRGAVFGEEMMDRSAPMKAMAPAPQSLAAARSFSPATLQAARVVPFPRTATAAEWLIRLGLALIILGGIVLGTLRLRRAVGS
ncbi:MAG: marine proteobacterial sortase target protein [Magnetovibrionaceae bacterium]